jgi:N-acetyl-gamma-glutamyl-phosphate reductase
VYGLCEHNREAIAKARIIANPGCYPTSILLPLLPLLKENGADIGTIIADSKSGVSGAGRTLKQASHFVEANENLSAYATGHKHRHVPEMEQELSGAAGAPIRLTFSPHLIPLNRGMLSTMYLNGKGSPGDYWDILNRAYEAERFVQVRELHELPSIRHVANTNGCAIGVTDGGIEGQVVILSVIDNLLKGASGQALQSMNIMFGLPEESGLWP